MLYNSVSLRLYLNFIAQFFRKLGKRARPVTHAVFSVSLASPNVLPKSSLMNNGS